MHKTRELRSLLHAMEEKEKHQDNLRKLVNQLENQGRKIKNTYLPIPQQETNYFKATTSIGFNVLWLSWMYLLIYIIVLVALGLLYLVLLIPGWIFGFLNAIDIFMNFILYILVLPALWLSRFTLWLLPESVQTLPFVGGFSEILYWIAPDYSVEGVAIVIGIVLFISVVTIVSLFVLDILLIPIRSATISQYNASILKKNKETETLKIKALENWARSAEYGKITRHISEVKANINKTDEAIKNNNILHSSLKDRDTVVRLINILETGRAMNLVDAINKMDEDIHNEKLEQMQWEAIYRAEEEAEKRAQENRLAQERSEAILRQIANSSARTEETANAIFWMGVIDLLDD